jgi:hypothetical protein
MLTGRVGPDPASRARAATIVVCGEVYGRRRAAAIGVGRSVPGTMLMLIAEHQALKLRRGLSSLPLRVERGAMRARLVNVSWRYERAEISTSMEVAKRPAEASGCH